MDEKARKEPTAARYKCRDSFAQKQQGEHKEKKKGMT